MAAFDGTSCPEEHLMAYKNLMLLYTNDPSLWCKFFPTTLTGVALTWYTSLPGGSIHNFAQLEEKFLGHFVASRRQEKSNFHLLSITQLEGESISSYLKKFHEAVLEAHDPKKRRSDKKDPIANHPSRNREEQPSRRERNYMPRRQEPPSDMGPPRPRHVYVTEGEPRTRNLLDGGYTEEYPTIRAARDSVHTLLKGPPKASTSGPIMKFDATTSQTLQQPHTDPLVVTLKIGQMKVKRVLVDTGSTADLITMKCLRKMKFEEQHLQPLDKPLIGFEGSQVIPLGTIILPVRVGERNESRTMPIRFTVVDLTFPYNTIMGLPLINKIKAAIFPHQLLLQFERDDGQVGILKGDQVTARQCLTNTLKRGTSTTPSKREREEQSPSVMSVYLESPNPQERPRPVERYEEVDIFGGKRIKIGKDLPAPIRQDIVATLTEFRDIFAFSTEEMPGIPTNVMCHKLDIKPGYKPVKQKLRHQGKERIEAAREEVEKLLRAGFIKECKYSDWLSNVVLVKKANGKWRMCVDFTDLNKACPKDDYPLLKIDLLVDSTAGHALLSFMDANAGYHQIPLAIEDQPHTTFITNAGVYCYKVMPFGLKNAGATYQRMVNKVFQSQIGRNLEVYVDDMITKSKQASQHAADLRETFNTLRKHQMRLNPEKCVFGVTGGKCLGFLVDERGIEANPDKIKAIQDMKSPRSVKEVQREKSKFEWTQEAEESFQQLKEHLSSLPKLVSPYNGEKLVLYVSVSEYSLSGVLIAEREKKQFPIYYKTKTLLSIPSDRRQVQPTLEKDSGRKE
ncbi:uncharacterized protein LOC130798860 [Amaranthus tricolor]|uniref:uncharacterized protein LOC130798860 n=1 Tax=Amaranthus tricolor TaxID=29722 RepID=UPI00258ED6F7|nr:uncharacterized protein LOC130798860 [Amaranthus tricolor]